MRAVAPAVPGAGPQAEVLPAASVARNWTSVSPSAEGRRSCRPPAAPHDAPPSVDSAVLVRRRRPESGSTAGVAVEDDAGDVLPGQRAAGGGGRRSGAVRSIRMVLAGVGHGRRPGRCVAGRVDGAELDDALALGADHGRSRRRGARPAGAAVGGRAELVAGHAGQAVRAARAVEGDAADALPDQRCRRSPSARSGWCGRAGRCCRSVALAGAHRELLPAASVARNWTSVSSSADDGDRRAGAGVPTTWCRRRARCGARRSRCRPAGRPRRSR